MGHPWRGVAEMLRLLLGYLAGAGIQTSWLVLGADEEFFEVTKQLHHLLHGQPGDGGPLGRAERVVYRRTLDQALEPPDVDRILHVAGILQGRPGSGETVRFRRLDGSPGRVERRAAMREAAPLPPSAPMVVQVSRLDWLKDPLGVLDGFVRHVDSELGAHLVLAGPAAGAVQDDPESAEVLHEVERALERLPRSRRERVHLACLAMDDLEENGATVNALQRRADVLVQKSLAEGFGLTVAEAMWKAQPVVGGIQDQITHGETGLLLDDPGDLSAFGRAVQMLLQDRRLARRTGRQAHDRVLRHYLAPRRLGQELDLIHRTG